METERAQQWLKFEIKKKTDFVYGNEREERRKNGAEPNLVLVEPTFCRRGISLVSNAKNTYIAWHKNALVKCVWVSSLFWAFHCTLALA